MNKIRVILIYVCFIFLKYSGILFLKNNLRLFLKKVGGALFLDPKNNNFGVRVLIGVGHLIGEVW